MLQERSVSNRDTSLYPVNVFQIFDEEPSLTDSSPSTRTPHPFERTWEWFTNRMVLKLNEDQCLAFAQCTESNSSQKYSMMRKLPSVRELDEEMSVTYKATKKKAVVKPKTPKKKLHQNRIVPATRQSMEFDVIMDVDDVTDSVQRPEDADRSPVDPMVSGDSSDHQHSAEKVYEALILPSESLESLFQKEDRGRDDHRLSVTLPVDAIETHQGEEAVEAMEVVSEQKYSNRSRQPSINSKVTFRHSIRTQLMSLFVLLLVGCVLTMLWTVSHINQYGNVWSNATEDDMRATVVKNLQSIANGKTAYILVFTSTFYNNRVVSNLLVFSSGVFHPNDH